MSGASVTPHISPFVDALVTRVIHGQGRDVWNISLADVVETMVDWARARGIELMLDDPQVWQLPNPLGPTLGVMALGGPCPVDATFCMRCVRTWRSCVLGSDPPCFFPSQRPKQVKCHHCSEGRHACLPVCFLGGEGFLIAANFSSSQLPSSCDLEVMIARRYHAEFAEVPWTSAILKFEAMGRLCWAMLRVERVTLGQVRGFV